LDKLCDYDLIS